MQYFQNDFYPAWVPEGMRHIINLSELAELTTQINEAATFLMEKTGANIAVYKNMHGAIPNGLCSFFKAADLQSKQLEILSETERRLKDYVFVAYANPLERQEKETYCR